MTFQLWIQFDFFDPGLHATSNWMSLHPSQLPKKSSPCTDQGLYHMPSDTFSSWNSRGDLRSTTTFRKQEAFWKGFCSVQAAPTAWCHESTLACFAPGFELGIPVTLRHLGVLMYETCSFRAVALLRRIQATAVSLYMWLGSFHIFVQIQRAKIICFGFVPFIYISHPTTSISLVILRISNRYHSSLSTQNAAHELSRN